MVRTDEKTTLMSCTRVSGYCVLKVNTSVSEHVKRWI